MNEGMERKAEFGNSKSVTPGSGNDARKDPAEKSTEPGQTSNDEELGEKRLDLTHKEAPEPLFLQDSSDSPRGNAQDEKDETEE